MSLADKFNDFAEAFMADHPDINYGGCGVFAANLGAALKEAGYDAKCVVFSNYFDPISAAKVDLGAMQQSMEHWDLMEDWYDQGISFYHVMLEVAGNGEHFLADAEGTYPADTPNYRHAARLGGTLSVETMAVLAEDNDWNTTFNREEIPTVRSKLRQFVEDIKHASIH